MVTKLKKTCKELFGEDYNNYYDDYKRERLKDGVSHQDASFLGNYLDAVIFNGLQKYLKNNSAVAYSCNEDDAIKELTSIFGLIVANDIKMEEDTHLTFEDYSKLQAENYAYRCEAMDMLLGYWDILYTIDI